MENHPSLEINRDTEDLTVEGLFKVFKKKEERLADPNEKILVGKIKETDPEFQKLLQAGLTREEITERQIPRGLLQQAGFAFNNYPFLGIEKPLINSVVNGVNYGQRKLLTGEELETIKKYQRENPELYGGDKISSDDFRQTMLSFLLTAENILPMHVDGKSNFLNLCITYIDRPYKTIKGEQEYKKDKFGQKINPLYKQLVRMYCEQQIGNSPSLRKRFIETKLKKVMPWDETNSLDRFNINARGHKMMLIETRRSKVVGAPSPFLDSGFHLPQMFGNPDYTIVGSDGRQFRVNMLVLHLASRGLSEMGEGTTGDGEQDYSIGNYVRDLEPKNAHQTQEMLAKENDKFQIKLSFDEEKLMNEVIKELKKQAMEWAETDNTTPEAQKLATQIKNIKKRFNSPIFRTIFGR